MGNDTISLDPRRGTGRTTRMLLEAIGHMKRGKRVVVVGHTVMFARHMRKMATDLLEKIGDDGWAASHDRITLGVGEIQFRSIADARGVRPGNILVDHEVDSYRYRDELRMLGPLMGGNT